MTLLRALNSARVEAAVFALNVAVDLVGLLADATAARAERVAETARWVAFATRTTP